ncbi:sporulation-induced protein [Coemansia sp. RSA 990]|nr:sporulation-induced protein [Coemansia sp. RSA 990]
MLWRFGLQHASNLDKLLEKEDVTLEEVLNDPDLQQELREQTPKLISYLVQPANLKQMVEYIATEDFFKFTKMAGAACEVLCSNSPAFAEGLTAAYVVRDFEESDESETETEEGEQASQHLLQLLWGVMRLEAGQLDAQQATLFSRVMCSLLQRKPYEALDFVRLQGAAVTQFLEHLGVSAVVDLLLKVISLEELEGGPGIIAWLSSHRLVGQLVDRLAPDRDPDTHSLAAQVLLDIIAISQCNNPAQPTIGTNALIAELKSAETVGRLADYMLDREAPHATSTLVNCVYIFIELIRRNYSEADLDDREDDEEEEEEEARVRLPAVDLSEMMGVLADRVGDLVALLRSPRSSIAMVPTTQGLREPLGFERLRICELFAELLHCSNMPRLNVLNNGADSPTVAQARGPEVVLDIGEAAGRTAATTPVGQLLKWRLIEHDVLPLCTDLFFKFSLNNFLHSVVYDVMHQVLNLPLSLECNVALIVTAFRDVRITSRIAQASERNDESMRAPRGVRLGFMGHLSGIGEEVARLLELSGAALEPLIAPYIDGDEWLDYVARTLQEAREREQQPLGGERPGPGFVGAADPTDIDMLSDAGGQVFVSRMGLVDAGAGDAYVDDEDDEDVDDERSSDVPHAALMYPNTEDDEPSDYMTHPSLYFGRSQGEDDEDQFIIRDIDDDSNSGSGSNSDSDDDADEEDIGPAGRMGRFRSYQNEIPPAAPSDDEDEDSNVPSDDASNGAQAEAATAQPPVPGAASSDGSDEQGNEGSVAACSDCSAIDDEDDGAGSALPATWEDVEETDACQARRQLNRLSLDGTSAPLELDCEAPDQINGASIAAQDPAPAVSSADEEQPPPMPPRPSDADCASFQDNMARLAAQGSTIKLPALVGGHVESKGLVQSLLQRESKQRSLSSSELDNIVPAGIGRWDPRDSGKASGGGSGSGTGGGNAGADGAVADGVSAQGSESDEGSGRSRSGSFATRRRRSRSQSAGVGISRAMVIQAAVQGQFPYLDAKTCQFVGQLKSDTVTLGGAAASSSSARPRSKPIPPMPSSSPSPSPSPPAMKPASDNVPPIPQRPPSLPPSSLRMRSSAIASDSDDDDVFPPIPPLPSISMPPPSTLRTGLPTPANSVGSQAKQHQHLASSDKSSSLTYAAVAMSSASAGVSALPTPSIVTTGLPSYPLPAAGASKPAPLPMTWAAVASSAAGASHTSSVANGRSAVGGNRNYSMMAPLDDDDESVDWYDYSYGQYNPQTKSSTLDNDIDELSDMLQCDDGTQADAGLVSRSAGANVAMVDGSAYYNEVFAVTEVKASSGPPRAASTTDSDTSTSQLDGDTKQAFKQLFLHSRQVFAEQPDRRFIGALASHEMDITTAKGRCDYIRLLVNWCLCDWHQLGFDPSVRYCEGERGNGHWEIDVPQMATGDAGMESAGSSKKKYE